MLGDALASLAVIAAAVIIQTTGLRVADPLASGLIGLFIVPRTVGLIRQAVHGLGHQRFGIDHATIQVEPASTRPADQGQGPPPDGRRICGAGTTCVTAPAPAPDRSTGTGAQS